MSRPELRIGDRERESALTALGEHYAAGRISKEEYDERSAVVWGARTNSQLWPVFVDLPGPHQSGRSVVRATPPAPSWGTASTGGRSRHGGFRFPFLPLLVVILGVVLLTEGWPVLLLLGVLWWAGVFRWLRRACGGGHRPTREGAA